MKIKLLVLILLFYKFTYAQSEKLEDSKMDKCNNIISLFKQKNIDKISSIIDYPLHSEYPIPSIKNNNN